MKGDLKARGSKAKLTHLEFAKAHRWCSENVESLKTSTYESVAKAATAILGFDVSASSIGVIGRDLGIAKHGEANGGMAGTAFLPNNKRSQAIYACIDELYDQLEIKSARRDTLREIFGVRKLGGA